MRKPLLILLMACCSLSLKAQTADSVTNKFNKIPYVRFDVFAKFPNGDFEEYVKQHITYPAGQEQYINGRIAIAYSVDVEGNVVNARLLSNLSPAVDREFLRVFNSSPKWVPAMYRGNKVEANIGAIFIVDVNAINKTIILTKPKSAVMSDAERENAVFTAVETPPSPPGGIEGFNDFLNKNVNYPQSALDQKIDGKVILSFVIEKDGSLSAFKVLRSPSDDLSNESVRVLKFYKYIPGSQNGKKVRVQQVVVINYDHKHPNDHSYKSY